MKGSRDPFFTNLFNLRSPLGVDHNKANFASFGSTFCLTFDRH
ncbi:hypothetical protein GM3708_1231 [Geminocystis sp. NIES-3708]|nr:hypothetical protein GM3708_1231 [Geminocystis sp. NIES-3708]